MPDTPVEARHPLATQRGAMLLVELVTAYKTWDAMTKRQRELLCELCEPLAPRVKAQEPIQADALPTLPVETRSSTRGSMRNAGLVDRSGRLTFKAVHAWFYKTQFGSGGVS